MQAVRPAAVAGLFYPADPRELQREVDRLVEGARPRVRHEGWPKALVLPHAGYVYSGATAALGYAVLEHGRGTITRVILLGPTHRVAVQGLALPEAASMATPLGTLRVGEVDPAVRRRLPQVVDAAAVHAQEHSLEVHLPFLQTVLGDVEVVPLAVGRATPEVVAEVIDVLWGGAETVVVVSSDLSHYHPYDVARALDSETVERILALDHTIPHDRACGATPLGGLLVAARRRGLRPRLLDLCSSGDTAGDRRRVVGYAAVVLDEPVAA